MLLIGMPMWVEEMQRLRPVLFTCCRHFIYKDHHHTTAACTATDHVLLTKQFQYNQSFTQSLKAFCVFLT